MIKISKLFVVFMYAVKMGLVLFLIILLVVYSCSDAYADVYLFPYQRGPVLTQRVFYIPVMGYMMPVYY